MQKGAVLADHANLPAQAVLCQVINRGAVDQDPPLFGIVKRDCCINRLSPHSYGNTLFSCSQTKQLANERDLPSDTCLSVLNMAILDRSYGLHSLQCRLRAP